MAEIGWWNKDVSDTVLSFLAFLMLILSDKMTTFILAWFKCPSSADEITSSCRCILDMNTVCHTIKHSWSIHHTLVSCHDLPLLHMANIYFLHAMQNVFIPRVCFIDIVIWYNRRFNFVKLLKFSSP